MSYLFFPFKKKQASSWQPPCDDDRHVPPWVCPCLAWSSHTRQWLSAGCSSTPPERRGRHFSPQLVLHWSYWDPAASSAATPASDFWISAPRFLSWAIQFPPVEGKYMTMTTMTLKSGPPHPFSDCVNGSECYCCLFVCQFKLSLQEVSNCSSRWTVFILPHQQTAAIRKEWFHRDEIPHGKDKKNNPAVLPTSAPTE